MKENFEQAYIVPVAVKNSVKKGLELHKRFHRKQTRSYLQAQKLLSSYALLRSDVEKIGEFFDYVEELDFEKRLKDGGPPTAVVNYLLNGGASGEAWISTIFPPPDLLEKQINVEVSKVDEELGIVFGYAIICKDGGQEYYDSQDDYIPESAMLEATASFMEGRRVAKVMHEGGQAGQVVYGFPVTDDIAKALEMKVAKTGFIVGMRPHDDDILDMFKSGELTGFSIGGSRVSETVIEE